MLFVSGNEPISASLLGYGWILERNAIEVGRGFDLFRQQASYEGQLVSLVDLRLHTPITGTGKRLRDR